MFLEWDPEGRLLFLTSGERFERRSLYEYRVTDRSFRALELEVGDFYDLAVV